MGMPKGMSIFVSERKSPESAKLSGRVQGEAPGQGSIASAETVKRSGADKRASDTKCQTSFWATSGTEVEVGTCILKNL